MSLWFETLAVLSVAGTTVVACILFLNLILRDFFTAKWQYLIRKLAILFFIVPIWSIAKLTGFFSLEPNKTTAVNWSEIFFVQDIPIEWVWVIFGVWVAGGIICGGWYVYCYKKFRQVIKQSSLPVSDDSDVYELLETHKRTMGINRNIKLAYNAQIASPALIGLIRPTIVLPVRKIPPVELGFVIRHELFHFKRKDLWVKMVVLVASVLHWFNPFIHIFRKDIQLWGELSCDEEVVNGMSYAERKKYGETILNLLEVSLATETAYSAFLSNNKKSLKKRLTMLLNDRKRKTSMFVITMMTIFILMIIGTIAGAWALENSPTVHSEMSKTAIYDPNDQKAEAEPDH